MYPPASETKTGLEHSLTMPEDAGSFMSAADELPGRSFVKFEEGGRMEREVTA